MVISQLVGAAGRLAQASIAAASALNEQASASNFVFEGSAQLVQVFAQQAASIGVSERAALQSANTFGNLFRSLGTGVETAADLSTAVIALSADIASFRDFAGGAEAVQQALVQALSGQTEVARRLGAFYNEAAVEAKALELRQEGVTGAVSEAEKVFARLALIVAANGLAAGDYLRTSDSLANQQRNLSAEVENLKAQLGEELLPAAILAARVLLALARGVGKVSDAFREFRESKAFQTYKEVLKAAFPLIRVLDFVKDKLEETAPAANEAAGAVGGLGGALAGASAEAVAAAGSLEEINSVIKSLQPTFASSFSAAQSAASRLESANRAAGDAARGVGEAQEAAAEGIARADENLTRTREQNARKIADAQQNIVDVQRDITRGLEDQNRRVADSIRDVADAEQELAEVRRDSAQSVSDAYEDAAKSIQDTQRATAEAIEDAQRRLDQLRNPRRESQRQQRLRAIREAEQALADAQEEGARRVAETQEEAAERIASAEESSAERIESATARVGEAKKRQKDAERDLVQFREDSARRQADAQQQLADVEVEVTRSLVEAVRQRADAEESGNERIASARRAAANAGRDAAEASKELDTATRFLIDSLSGTELILQGVIREQLEAANSTGDLIERYTILKSILNKLASGEYTIDVALVFKKLLEAPGQRPDLGTMFQHGGDIAAGQLGVVGEAGPELFIPNTGGHILSNSDSKALVALLERFASDGGSSRPSVRQEFHNSFAMPSVADPEVLARAVALRLARMLTR